MLFTSLQALIKVVQELAVTGKNLTHKLVNCRNWLSDIYNLYLYLNVDFGILAINKHIGEIMYDYQKLKPEVFKEENQQLFLKIRDKVKNLKESSGCFQLESLMRDNVGDTWVMMACVDRLVELGEITEIPQGKVAGQHRIFK